MVLELHNHCLHSKYQVTSRPALPSHVGLAAVVTADHGPSGVPEDLPGGTSNRLELRLHGWFRMGLTGLLGFHLDQ